MNSESRKHVYYRLACAHDLASLKKVWDSLGTEVQKDPDVQALKDRLKRSLDG